LGVVVPNITLSVDERIIKKVRKIAVERNTTLTALIREYLRSVAMRDEADKREAAAGLRKTFDLLGRDMGERRWQREELYDRFS
jgi:hypothetical protein